MLFLGYTSKEIIDWLKDKHQEFRREYLIKAELRSIKHNLEVGGRPHKIEPIYGAAYVRDHHLFGEYGTQVLCWYKGFEDYNIKFEAKNHDHNEILLNQRSMANLMGGILKSQWLKKIPDDYSDLSTIKFIRYLLGRDAIEEPTKKDWWQFWK